MTLIRTCLYVRVHVYMYIHDPYFAMYVRQQLPHTHMYIYLHAVVTYRRALTCPKTLHKNEKQMYKVAHTNKKTYTCITAYSYSYSHKYTHTHSGSEEPSPAPSRCLFASCKLSSANRSKIYDCVCLSYAMYIILHLSVVRLESVCLRPAEFSHYVHFTRETMCAVTQAHVCIYVCITVF
jgi:hypothetical protein